MQLLQSGNHDKLNIALFVQSADGYAGIWPGAVPSRHSSNVSNEVCIASHPLDLLLAGIKFYRTKQLSYFHSLL